MTAAEEKLARLADIEREDAAGAARLRRAEAMVPAIAAAYMARGWNDRDVREGSIALALEIVDEFDRRDSARVTALRVKATALRGKR